MPTVSVIVPTRNRAALWQSAWLMDSLRDQDDQPDELVIALDHTEDDTLETITADITTRPVHFPVRILEVLAPRPEPFPASGTPDNCLFHAATGDILLHVDDDIALAPGTVRHARTLLHELPRAALWYLMTFVDENRRALAAGADWRLALASRLRLPLLPGGMMQPPATSSAFTGAIFATTRTALHAIGGHDMRHVGYHNQDTRLGNRLLRYCIGSSYIIATPSLTALHFGLTWHMQNVTNTRALRSAYGATLTGPTIANAGERFWSSDYFATAYRELKLDTLPFPATLKQRAALDRKVRSAARAV